MTRRSTFTPVCLVYCSASPCQKGFVWSLLYSAITTVMPPLAHDRRRSGGSTLRPRPASPSGGSPRQLLAQGLRQALVVLAPVVELGGDADESTRRRGRPSPAPRSASRSNRRACSGSGRRQPTSAVPSGSRMAASEPTISSGHGGAVPAAAHSRRRASSAARGYAPSAPASRPPPASRGTRSHRRGSPCRRRSTTSARSCRAAGRR